MSFQERGRGGGRPDDIVEIEAMFRELKNKVPGAGLVAVVGVVLALIWLSTGFYIVAPDERGVVLRFGRVVRITDPGPHLLFPWPFESVTKANVTEVQRVEIGFRTRRIEPRAEYEDVPAESHMLTGDENIVALDFIAQYEVKRVDGQYAVSDYLFNLRPSRSIDPRKRGEDLSVTVKEVAEASMREVVGRHRIDEVLTGGKDAIQREALELMQSILDRYAAGVQITAVQLQDVQPPTEDVKNAFKDVASAREDKVRTVQVSESYRNDIIPRARGQAQAILAGAEAYASEKVARARGESERFLSMLAEYDQARDVTRERLYLEALEEVLAPAEKIILDTRTANQVLPYLPLRPDLTRPREP
jgi:modulator of FtsH protease HflK